MKKNGFESQTISVTYFHRTRYQQRRQQELSGERHLCHSCQMLLAVRKNNTWHLYRNGLGVRSKSPCHLESDCPGCGRTHILETFANADGIR